MDATKSGDALRETKTAIVNFANYKVHSLLTWPTEFEPVAENPDASIEHVLDSINVTVYEQTILQLFDGYSPKEKLERFLDLLSSVEDNARLGFANLTSSETLITPHVMQMNEVVKQLNKEVQAASELLKDKRLDKLLNVRIAFDNLGKIARNGQRIVGEAKKKSELQSANVLPMKTRLRDAIKRNPETNWNLIDFTDDWVKYMNLLVMDDGKFNENELPVVKTDDKWRTEPIRIRPLAELAVGDRLKAIKKIYSMSIGRARRLDTLRIGVGDFPMRLRAMTRLIRVAYVIVTQMASVSHYTWLPEAHLHALVEKIFAVEYMREYETLSSVRKEDSFDFIDKNVDKAKEYIDTLADEDATDTSEFTLLFEWMAELEDEQPAYMNLVYNVYGAMSPELEWDAPLK